MTNSLKTYWLIAILIILLTFIVGCTGSDLLILEQEDDTSSKPSSITKINKSDKLKRPIIKDRPKKIIKEETKVEPKERYYDVKQIEKDYNDILNETENYSILKTNESDPGFIYSELRNRFVIQTLSDEKDHIKNVGDFCDKYCAKNWDGLYFYFYRSYYDDYHEPMDRKNFTTDYRYNEYISDRIMLERNFREDSFNVENGVIGEFQYIEFEKSYYGLFDHGLETLLLYKVYCSPNMTLLIQPELDEFWDWFGNLEVDIILKDWDEYVLSVRDDMLIMGNEFLSRCPVEKEFFKGFSFPKYSKTETLAFHFRDFYENRVNLTTIVQVGAESTGKEDEYQLKEVNVSFTNNDDFDIDGSSAIKIIVIIDGKRDVDYYDAKAGELLKPGESRNRSVKKQKIIFHNNLTIETSFYGILSKIEVRPYKKTFTLADMGLTET